jgi:hypothetical protein
MQGDVMKILKWILSLSICGTAILGADIEKVTVQWTQARYNCDAGCLRLLDNQFRRISGVSDVAIDQGAAQATLQWNPNVPFSYTAIDTAMRMVGPSIDNLGVRLKVRGTIRHDANSVTLISLGDNTNFFLLSPITPSSTQFVDTESVASRPLWPQVRTELLDAEAQNLIVTIDGPLFQPERAPPFYIIVEQKKVSKPDTQPADR